MFRVKGKESDFYETYYVVSRIAPEPKPVVGITSCDMANA